MCAGYNFLDVSADLLVNFGRDVPNIIPGLLASAFKSS